MIPIVTLYKAILESLGMTISKEGLVSFSAGDKLIEAMCDQKRIALPTREVLANSNWDNVIAFHPLSENITMGQSPMVKKLRAIIDIRLTSAIYEFMHQMMVLAADTEKHSKLSPKQLNFLVQVSEADQKTINSLNAIIRSVSTVGSHRIIHVNTKRGATLVGKPYSRAALVYFPIVDEFENRKVLKDGKEVNDYSIFEVKMTKKDKQAIQSLFEWIFPDAGDVETYSVGSNSLVAPYFDSLIRAYLGIANHINAKMGPFRKFLTDPSAIEIDTSWADDFDNLEQYRGMLPTPLAGNDGTAVKGGSVPVANNSTAMAETMARAMIEENQRTEARTVATTQPPVAQPPTPTGPAAPFGSAAPSTVTTDIPSAGVRDSGLDVSDVLMRRQAATAMQYMPPAPFGPNGMVLQQPMYPPVQPMSPVYQQPPMQQPMQQQVLYNSYGQPVDSYGRLLQQMPQQQMYQPNDGGRAYYPPSTPGMMPQQQMYQQPQGQYYQPQPQQPMAAPFGSAGARYI